MPDISQIPGGAATQVANQAGDPSVVGLTPAQTMQQGEQYDAMIARGDSNRPYAPPAPQGEPIPVWGPEGDPYADQPDDFMPPFEDPQKPQENTSGSNLDRPDEPRKVLRVRLPNGVITPIRVPESYDEKDVKNFLIDRGVEGMTPDGTTWERFGYGFQKDGNIFTNSQDYLISMWPALAMENVWNPETGRVELQTAETKFGKDFNDMTPQQRRERMKEVKAANLQKKYPDVNPNNLGTAGTVGAIAKGVADPTNVIPVGGAVKAGTSAWKLGRNLSIAGAGWGGAYGVSEQLAEKGAPTTLEELKQTGERALEPAIAGAVLAPALGVPLIKGVEAVAGHYSFDRRISTPEKAANFGKRRIFPMIWEGQAAGLSSAEATSRVMRKYDLTPDQLWKIKEALNVEQYGDANGWKTGVGKSKKKQAAAIENLKNPNKAIWAVADGREDAASRLGRLKGSNYGDPITHGVTQKHIDDFFRPVVGVVKDISGRVGNRLLQMEGQILAKTHSYHQELGGFRDGYNRLRAALSDKDMDRFTVALYNSDREAARRVWQQAGVEMEAFDRAMKGIDTMSDDLAASGAKFERQPGYFPRLVSDYEGLKAHLKGRPKYKGLEKALKDREAALNRSLSDSEATEVINAWLAGYRWSAKKGIKQLQKRTVSKVDAELSKFYFNPAESLEYHMRETISKAERNRFYGKTGAVMNEGGMEDVGKSIGAMIREEGITGKDADRLKAVLISRFTKGEETGIRAIAAGRALTGGATLGNPISAIRQLGDMPAVMASQGIINTFRAMFSKNLPELTPADFGYMLEMAQELDGKGIPDRLRKASDFMYKWGGFREMDRYTKGTFMRAAVRKAQRMNRKPTSGSKKDFQAWANRRAAFANKYADVYQPSELAQLMDDLAEGRMTDLVKSHINSEIMGIQPISRSHMSKVYLDHPNGRVFYQFRTWGLNQLEFVRRNMWREINSGDPKRVAQGLGVLTTFLIGTGVTNQAITEIQKWLTHREGEPVAELGDDVIWAALGNFGVFDRYGMEQAAQRGDFMEWAKTLAPPVMSIGGAFGMAVFQAAWNEAPLSEGMINVLKQTGYGRMLNFLFFGGAEEYNKKQEEKRWKESNQLTGIDKMR